MIETAISKPLRGFGAVALLLLAFAAPAAAQYAPPPASVPGAAPRNQTCLRLESQLAGVDRGTVDPARAEQIRRYEEVIAKQQGELDRLGQQAQRMGCSGGGFFALFSGQPAQCGQLNNQIQQIRANLDRIMGDLQRAKGNSAVRAGRLLRDLVRNPHTVRDRPRRSDDGVRDLPHGLCADLRRLLLPDLLLHGTDQILRG